MHSLERPQWKELLRPLEMWDSKRSSCNCSLLEKFPSELEDPQLLQNLQGEVHTCPKRVCNQSRVLNMGGHGTSNDMGGRSRASTIFQRASLPSSKFGYGSFQPTSELEKDRVIAL